MQPFEEIVTEHGAVVRRVCRALLPPADADDAWSDTFLAALRAYPDLRPDSNVRGWLVTIAHRKAIDVLRRAARTPTPVALLPEAGAATRAEDPTGLAGLDGLDGGDGGDGLTAALAGLPPKQRGAVVYRYLADLPYAEVGDLLGCSPTAARRNAADGIAALRRHVTKGPR
jgi:RNA polymerase sigma factor (sigma-70 family)